VSPFVAYHTTPRRHRESIERYGLLPNLPNASQHFGIYVYQDDCIHLTRDRRRRRRYWTRWDHRPPHDLWQVGYVGPLCPDQYVTNGLVLFERPQYLSRVSHLSHVTTAA
jgi:hypothetical protein